LVTLKQHYVSVETYAQDSKVERPDNRDVRRVDSRDSRCCSAACSEDAFEPRGSVLQSMRQMDAFRGNQGDAGQRSIGYPPPLALENASANPDNEAWRRYNPFDKHYVGRGEGAIGPYDRSPSPQYRLGDPQTPDGGQYRIAPYRQTNNGSDTYCPPGQYNGNVPYDNGLRPPYGPNPYDRNPYENPYRRGPSDQVQIPPERYPGPERYPTPNQGGTVCRDASDRNSFYAHQNDGYSCSAFSMAMMASDWNTGRPPTNAESSRWKQIAGTVGQGYRGPLEQVAANLRQGIPDLHTKVYNYGMGRVGPQAMQDLNRELAQGHTAVAKVINPHTGNAHYIYIAGRTQNGEYILGDPDRKNPHQQPVSGARLMSMMSRRDGFVAGWKDSQSLASRSPGSAANRYAMAHYNSEYDNRAQA
jgi:hypothetical protein